MIKRLLRDYKIGKKVQEIRKREQSLGKSLPEPLRESRAREFIARKVILPEAKKIFGKSLTAVMIVGSARQGAREATRRHSSSDLDVLLVYDGALMKPSQNADQFGQQMDKLIRAKWGFPLQIDTIDSSQWLWGPSIIGTAVRPLTPAQIIYGKAAADKALAEAGYSPEQIKAIYDKKYKRTAPKPLNPVATGSR